MQQNKSTENFDLALWKKRLRFSARRGMLEVDALLQTYLKYENFDDPELRERFFELLDYSDLDLYRWFFAIEPAPEKIVDMLEDIKQCCRKHYTLA